MSIKVKLTSLITTFILLCSLLAVGVFAVKNTTFNVGGNIEFNVKGIEADINLTDPGTANLAVNNESPVMQPIQIRNTTTESEIVSAFSTWSNLDLAFSPNKSTATIELEISNKSTDANNYIGISASADALTKNNAEIIVTNNAGGSTALIGKDQTATFTITFKVVDDGYSAKLDNFVVKFDMKKLDTAELPTEGEVNSSITPSNENELTITKEDSTTKATQTLTETVSSTSQTTTYTYDVKNNSYTESIYLNPTATLSEEQTDVATTIYYSVEDNEISTFSTQSTEYKLLTEDYLVILPQKSVKVQVQMLPINVTSTKEVSIGVELNLHAEKPADFIQDYTYEIIDNEVYRTPICNTCECYQATEKMNADEYIIATPETAQSILDSNINGKTIVFAEGTYTNPLSIGVSRETSTAYEFLTDNWTKLGEEVAIGNLNNDPTVKYHYSRTIQNVTLAGTEKAVFNSGILIAANSISSVATQYGLTVVVDPIRRIPTANFIQDLKINNLHFANLNFVNNANIMFSSDSKLDIELKNISVTNCSFVNKGNLVKTPAFVVGNRSADEEKITNFTFKNNYVDGYYWAVQTYETNNHKIINNTFKNIEDSAVCLRVGYEGDTRYTSGNIIIKGNTIDGCLATLNEDEGVSGACAITMEKCKNANILIENNSFKNCVKSYTDTTEQELLTATTLINSGLVFVNNVYEGVDMTNMKLAKGDYSNSVITK